MIGPEQVSSQDGRDDDGEADDAPDGQEHVVISYPVENIPIVTPSCNTQTGKDDQLKGK